MAAPGCHFRCHSKPVSALAILGSSRGITDDNGVCHYKSFAPPFPEGKWQSLFTRASTGCVWQNSPRESDKHENVLGICRSGSHLKLLRSHQLTNCTKQRFISLLAFSLRRGGMDDFWNPTFHLPN